MVTAGRILHFVQDDNSTLFNDAKVISPKGGNLLIEIKKGTIIRELFAREGIKGFAVEVEGREEKCIVYTGMTGEVQPGDDVLLNTTAVSLKLGTGGYHYVMANLNGAEKELHSHGHIMKLRYTPMQVKVLSVEEEDSPHRETMLRAETLEHTPVLVGTLHSMLAPLSLMLAEHDLKVAYVMTDGAALPIAFSNTVDWLKKNHKLAGTVTIGHAFGGDLEAVNIYSGLLAARHVLKADIIIVTMGPGIVGTGTKWGFTGVEQGEILNAVDVLQGIPIAVPRISFADARQRHHGISHHTITVLTRICRVDCLVPLPLLEEESMSFILEQIRQEGLFGRHHFCAEDGSAVINVIKQSGLKITTMGRGPEQEEEFFLTLGAAALTAARVAAGERPGYISIV
jgi:hypothetical protein